MPALRLVLDTNVLLSGLVSKASASQRIVDALTARKLIPLISPPVLAEYAAVLLHPFIQARFQNLNPRRVELVLRRLRYIGDEYRTGHMRFEFDRDPRDAKFLELAIAGEATHIISLDADLLSLSTQTDSTGRRFRQRLRKVEILQPQEFCRRYRAELGSK